MKKDIITAALMTPGMHGWGLPVCAWSGPGEGKTSVVTALAAELGLACEVLSPGERGEGAFGVVPVPGKDGVLHYPRPDWTKKFDDGAAGLVVVDELTTAPPAIQPPLLGLFLGKRIGGHVLGSRVRVLALANPPELAASGYELSPPQANRMGHLVWDAPTTEEHAAYMLSAGTGGDAVKTTRSIDDLEATVEKRWPDAFARARGLETAFLSRKPSLKNVCPKPGDPKASRAWPSDRTWEMATRALAGAEIHGLSEMATEEFVAAYIGEGAAGELFTFRQENDLPDPAAVLDGKEKFAHNSKRLDRTIATLNGCAALVTSPAAKPERVDAMWGLIDAIVSGDADFDLCVPAATALIAASKHSVKSAVRPLAKLTPVLRAADIKPR